MRFLQEHDELYDEEYLKPLRHYKYRGVDKSPISNYILQPYWNACTKLFPLWMAPNMITLLGFLLMVLALALVILYCPDLATPLPSYFYWIFFACIWIYSTFDNVDGKQARRTGTSSPLGELFDHGCDSINCWLVSLVQLASICSETNRLASSFVLLMLWGFYLPTWETYHTGVLYLGYVNGPTEGVIFGILMIMISAIYGPGIFHETVETFFPNLAIPAILVGTKTGHLVFTFVFIAGLSLLIPSSLIAVYQHGRDQNHKKISLFSAIGELGFMGLTTLAVIGWLWSPYTTALKQHFILFHCAVGLAFGKMATKIILAHLTKQPFPTYTGLMMPLHIGAVLFNALPMLTSLDSGLLAKLEHVYLWAFMIVAIVGYANWIYHVISSFCKFLDINCLTIKKVKKTVEDTGTETEIKLINRGIEATMVLGGKRATSSPYRSRTRQAIL